MTLRNNKHPSTKIHATYSDRLLGKHILLGITGSIASFLSPKLARELIRHGAIVHPVMTESALTMVGKDLLWWATGNEPIIRVTGNLEHIQFAGVMNKPVDLMLIMPCTTNTAAKLANGISDTSVTLIANTLRGKKIPIMVLCVAHEDLINSPPVQDSLNKLRGSGIVVLDPVVEEGKAKVPDTENIVMSVFNQLESKKQAKRHVIVTAGPTREYIDAVRFLSNPSSGKTGIAIATEAFLQGATVDLVLGPVSEKMPISFNVHNVVSSSDMTNKTISLLKDNPKSTVILSSAMADFTITKNHEKIKSGTNLKMELIPTVKLSNQIKKQFPDCTLVLFKAESGQSKEELIKRAKVKLERDGAEIIVANDVSNQAYGFASQQNQVIIIGKDGVMKEITGTKNLIAREIIGLLPNQI